MLIFNKLTTLEHEADNFGFRWDNTDQIMAQIKSECAEIMVHLKDINNDTKKAKLQEEIGDLLHAVFSLCVFCQFDPHETLEKSVNKFERRFKEVKRLTHAQGLVTLAGKSFQELMVLWNQVKQNE